MTHWQIVVRLLKFMKPLNGIMALSTFSRAVKLLMQTAIIAYAVTGAFLYLQAPEAATLWTIGGTLVLYAFVLGLFNYIETYTGHYVAFRLLAMLRNEFYDRMEPLAPAGTAELRTGDAVSRVINDCERVEPFYAHTIAPAICAIVVPSILLWYLAHFHHPLYAWTLAPFQFVMIFVLPLVTTLLGRQGGEKWRAKQGEVNAFLTDSFQGIRDTIAFGYGERRRRKAWEIGEELKRGQDHLTRADAFQRGFTEFVVAAAAVAMVWVSWDLVQAGQIEPLRTVPAVVAIVLTSFYATIGLNNVVNDYRVAIISARRLWEMMDQRPEVTDLVPASPAGVRPSIALRDVTFGYGRQAGSEILKGISLDIEPGRHVAIVGSSGAGKSTIANLLLRFWDARSGEVLIGGVPVQKFRLEDLRNMIAVVSQRNYIFNTTIGDNICMGKPGATQAEIEEAARRANLADWIATLPQGYDTPVGEMGSKVSGGQRQRIAIARALLKNAPILILDEATSNLDVETEREVNAAILVLEQGRIVEQGSHAELMRRNGVYARIFELQQDEVDARMEAAPVPI